MTASDFVGLTVTHRCYVSYDHAHYAGGLVAGAYLLGLFGDVATEIAIRTDGDEGLLAGYRDVRFVAPVRAGDLLEVTGTVTRVGARSRDIEFRAEVIARSAPQRSETAAELLTSPILVGAATGTVVVPN
jgi:3-aminobutyryl-CoA ammonia-lyase